MLNDRNGRIEKARLLLRFQIYYEMLRIHDFQKKMIS